MTAPTAAIITLKTRQIGTMNAIFLGPEVLVESECKPGTWYIVSDGKCTCPGHVYHGHCKHTAIAETAAMIDRNEAEPVKIETALESLTQSPSPEIAGLAAEILLELDGRDDLSGVEKKALARTTARVRLGLVGSR